MNQFQLDVLTLKESQWKILHSASDVKIQLSNIKGYWSVKANNLL